MKKELRCEHKLHGILEDGVLEIKCRSKLCGSASGVVVLHRYNAESGALLDTIKFKDPGR